MAKKWNQRSKIVAALRRVWRYSPMRHEALNRSNVGIKQRLCESCSRIFNPKLIEVHHKEPMMGILDWNVFIDKLFCSSTKLAVLCEECHKNENKKLQIQQRKISKTELREFS